MHENLTDLDRLLRAVVEFVQQIRVEERLAGEVPNCYSNYSIVAMIEVENCGIYSDFNITIVVINEP